MIYVTRLEKMLASTRKGILTEALSELKTAKWQQFSAIFNSKYHMKQLNPWPTLPVVWCFMPGCLHTQGRRNQLNTTWVLVKTWQALETSHGQATWIIFTTNSYLPELLVNVYSYHVFFIKSSHIILCDMYLHMFDFKILFHLF